MFDPELETLVLMPVAVLALAAAWFFLLAFRSRSRLEFRARLLEVLARATRNDLPLAPLLESAVTEHRGRRRRTLERIHDRLEEGASLNEACAEADRRFFPRHVQGALRAAEGTAALAPVLAATASDASTSLATRHRVTLTLVYPLLLGCVVVGAQQGSLHFLNDELTDWTPPAAAVAQVAIWAGLALVLAGTLAGIVLHYLRALPGARLVAGERMLRAMAPQIRAGLSLPESLSRCAEAAGTARHARAAQAAARRLESGAPLADVVTGLGWPDFVTVRLMGTGSREPGRLAQLLKGLADECARRYRARVERTLRWAYPLAIAAIGVLVALQFSAVMQIINYWQGVAWPW
ncbi:MAG: type II secretion system F family protein [Planctomycetota bacterium]|jgi:type II secretory pathway component PulF